jgi:hypothetical protein
MNSLPSLQNVQVEWLEFPFRMWEVPCLVTGQEAVL